MRNIVALALLILFPVSAFAYSPKPPERHRRYSPNSKYFIDFNPVTSQHTIYAADSPDAPLWSLECDAFWPYKHDESDGCHTRHFSTTESQILQRQGSDHSLVFSVLRCVELEPATESPIRSKEIDASQAATR